MKTRFRYEPPLFVDMRAPELCGEFANCATGPNRSLGSCAEYMRCYTGTGAERCDNGNNACGCDSCCGSGTGYTSTGGLPWVGGCQCSPGSQAYVNCNSGYTTASVCADGSWAGVRSCLSGTDVQSIMENCYPGA